MQTQVYSIDEIREIVAPIAKQHGVDKVFLFGSYARGDATPASDVDLCVDAPRLRGLFALGGLYADLEDALKKSIDVVTTGSLKYNKDEAFLENLRKDRVLLYELAQAQMAREIFPNAPLKYMPPTKFMTGNIFRGHIQDALFNMVTILTNQRLCLLGMMTEAIHTPFMSDRALSIENAQYIFRTMKDLGSELTYKENGIIRNRANEVLTKATDLLADIEKLGLFTTIEKGIFADVKRPKDGGKGLAGVVVKDDKYFNPFVEVMKGKVAAE